MVASDIADEPVGDRSEPRAGPSLTELVGQARQGDARAVARLISLVEDASPSLRQAMALLAPYSGHARVIGVTGSPGVGKSTTTTALVAQFRSRGMRVAVLAVDPSSPFSGGALLGDRVRMQEHATDPGVYIRSMATRGHLGGLAWSTPQVLRVLDAAGFDVVLVETVGVGQSEVEVAATADTVVVLLAPGMGDGIQAAKAGILEVGDVYAVNKADRDGADATARELRNVLRMGEGGAGVPTGWAAPVVKMVASRQGGVADLVEALDAHAAWLAEAGGLASRRRRRAASEIRAIAMAGLAQRMGRLAAQEEALAGKVAAGELDPYAAADQLVGLL